MKVTYRHTHNYFSIFSYWHPNWQVLWGKEKYLLNSLSEKLKKKGFIKTNVNSKGSLFQAQTNKSKVKYILVSLWTRKCLKTFKNNGEKWAHVCPKSSVHP